MNLETDREIKEKKDDKLDISIKEFKEIYKESKKNINVVNKQIEIIQEILDDINIKKLEDMTERIKEKIKESSELEKYLSEKMYEIDVYKEYIKKVKEDINREERRLTNISLRNMTLQEENLNFLNQINYIKNMIKMGFISSFILIILSFLYFVIFK